MAISYYTVTASLPGMPSQLITSIASGPMAAVEAVKRSMVRWGDDADLIERGRYACRSGWFGLDGRRYEPRVNPQTAREIGAIA